MMTNESNQPNAVGAPETGVAEVCLPTIASPQHTRHGKIARLPLAIRTELNQRMRENEAGTDLVAWLNSLPEVQQVMKDHFASVAVNENNLSRWRGGGYQDWLAVELAKEGALKLSEQGDALKGFKLHDLTQNMALVTMAQLGVELRRIQSMEDDDARFKCLRELLWAVIFLQRNTAEAERIKQAERKKAGYLLSEEELEKQFWLWAKDPDHKESIWRRLFMSKEEKQAAIDHILADDSDYWLADEAYIKSIGGTLGGGKALEELKKMSEAAKARRQQETEPPCTAPSEAGRAPSEAGRASSEAGRAPSTGAAAPAIPVCPESPGQPKPAPIPPSEAGGAASPAQPPPNFVRVARAARKLVTVRHPRTGALMYKLEDEPAQGSSPEG